MFPLTSIFYTCHCCICINTVWCRYNAVNFLKKSSQKTHHSSPYGVCFMDSHSGLYYASGTAVMYAISCDIVSHYNVTQLYFVIMRLWWHLYKTTTKQNKNELCIYTLWNTLCRWFMAALYFRNMLHIFYDYNWNYCLTYFCWYQTLSLNRGIWI